ncbi:MAG: 50S ribosomal protein L24 [Acidobacteriota bacterium]
MARARPAHKVRIRRNDNVVVLAGKSRGKTGRVLRVLRSEGRAIVESINFVKRHTRPNPRRNIKGGILEREAPIDCSNVMVVCAECGRPTRIGHKFLDDGKKVRICKHCGGILDR